MPGNTDSGTVKRRDLRNAVSAYHHPAGAGGEKLGPTTKVLGHVNSAVQHPHNTTNMMCNTTQPPADVNTAHIIPHSATGSGTGVEQNRNREFPSVTRPSGLTRNRFTLEQYCQQGHILHFLSKGSQCFLKMKMPSVVSTNTIC